MHRNKEDHSITSSARPSNGNGTVMPSALAAMSGHGGSARLEALRLQNRNRSWRDEKLEKSLCSR
jgi:hypothetical protein